jgi:hypothetical protein
MLPFGISRILLRAAPPIIADLRTWITRPHADRLTTDRTQVEILLQKAARRRQTPGDNGPASGPRPVDLPTGWPRDGASGSPPGPTHPGDPC